MTDRLSVFFCGQKAPYISAQRKRTATSINDAVYERNAKVQELFDVKFSYDSRSGAGNTYAAWLNTLNSSILAGDNAYQLAGGSVTDSPVIP